MQIVLFKTPRSLISPAVFADLPSPSRGQVIRQSFPGYVPSTRPTPLQLGGSCTRAAGGMHISRRVSSGYSSQALCSALPWPPRFWPPQGMSRVCTDPQCAVQSTPQRKRDERFVYLPRNYLEIYVGIYKYIKYTYSCLSGSIRK